MDIKSFYRGDTVVWPIIVTLNDIVYNLTDCSIWFTMKENEDDIDSLAILQKSVSSHTSPTTGLSEMTLTAAETALLSARSYYYGFQLVDSTGKVTTLTTGTVRILKDITITTVEA